MNNKVVKDASWIIGCKIVQSILSLFISTISARYLGPSNFGMISYAASLVAFVLPIMSLGLENILVQETIQHPEQEGEIYGTSLILSCVSSLACMVGVISFVCIINAEEKETITVCALYSFVLLAQALELMRYWFQAKYLSKYVSIISLCAYAIVSGYKVFLLVTGKNVCWFAVSNAIDFFIISFSLIFCYRKLDGQSLKFSMDCAKRMLLKSRYYIIPSMMVTIFAETDKIMLKLMLDTSATGLYSIAVTCASLTSFVFVAIIDSMRPAIFESQKLSTESFEKNLSRLYTIVIYLSLLQSVFMTLLAKPIIYILYGNAYMPATGVLQIIVWYTTFAYLGAIRNIWILANGEQRHLWKINLSGAIGNIVLNSILIPLWGMHGAAVASLATQIFTNVVLGWIIKPIRRNNVIMLRSLNPNGLVAEVKKYLKRID